VANKKKSKKSAKKHKYTAKTADKHHLYQLSVQEPEFEVDFINRIYRRLRGRRPMSLREDFCGTALFCGTWVKSNKNRTAIGIDIDQSVLDWGVEHNLKPLSEPGQRIKLYTQDVREPVPDKVDVCTAFNFSYWCFQERETLRSYFAAVKNGLNEEGLFFLDAYGGYESHEPDLEEPRKIPAGFTYTWHQDKVDPINNTVVNHIHFKFRDKTKIRKAFTYEWRFWSLRELRELLEEAGFKHVTVYWEDADEEGEGNGVYRPRKRVSNEAGWIAYITAQV
jgi:hypothetical protein